TRPQPQKAGIFNRIDCAATAPADPTWKAYTHTLLWRKARLDPVRHATRGYSRSTRQRIRSLRLVHAESAVPGRAIYSRLSIRRPNDLGGTNIEPPGRAHWLAARRLAFARPGSPLRADTGSRARTRRHTSAQRQRRAAPRHARARR